MRFVSQPLIPDISSVDTTPMTAGEPGFPARFRLGSTIYEVVEILGKWREHGDCRHGSGERYLRRHGYRVRTREGEVLKILFHRSFDRPKRRGTARWWLQSIEEASSTPRDSA